MRKKLLNNIGIKILSVLAAIIIWVLVVNVDDYMVTKTITDVPVDVLNEDSIRELDKVYELEGNGFVTILVKGRRSIVEGMTAQDFTATVDLAQLSLTSAVQVVIEPVKATYKNELTISCPNNMLSVSLENRMESQIPVTVHTTGTPQDGYAVGNRTTSPNMITIAGAESVVKKVAAVQVVVDVSGAASDVSVVVPPEYLNADGDKLSSAKLDANVETVNAVVEILKTKEIPVFVSTSGEVASGYGVIDVIYQPTKILVAGKDEVLSQIDELYIRNVRITRLSKDDDITVNVADYLPDGVLVADGTEQIMIQILIEPLITKDFVLSIDMIEVEGKQEEYQYQLTAFTETTEDKPLFHVRGMTSLLDDFSLSDLKLSVDVSELGEGEYDLELNYALPDKLSGRCDAKIHVVVSKSADEEIALTGTEEQ